MKSILALIIIITLTGCGRDPREGEDHTGEAGQERIVDPELETYVQKFEEAWGHQISFRVKISDLPSDRAGLCTSWTNGDKLAEIDLQVYQTYGAAQIEQIVMHELGHCALNRDHDDSNFVFATGTAPNSVMRSMAFDNSQIQFYNSYKQHYINDLFGR